jgi:E3 ubiquitin-protein ligase MYCBP2
VCKKDECLEWAKDCCTATLPCGHFCGGCRGEEKHLPCYQGCDGVELDPESYCTACFTEPLTAGPSLQLKCGHAFHARCCKAKIESGCSTSYLTFGHLGCANCRERMDHPMLKAAMAADVALEEETKSKALMRLKYENKDKHPDITTPGSAFYNDPVGYALKIYAYYKCFKCKHPYYGGERVCAPAAGEKPVDPSELICPGCNPHAGDMDCPKHGKDYIEFKCKFCCGTAVFFCWGTTHFCSELIY